jgi:hypothetical protein
MAYTLTEAQKYAQDQLLSGVVETIVRESPMLGQLPFIEVTGNALKYLRENAMAPAAWFNPGDTWSEGTQTVTEVTVALKILGGDADVDKFLQQSRSNPNDLEAEAVIAKSKALAHEWEDVTVYGDTSADAKKFDGLHKLVPSAQQVHAGSGSTGGAGKLIDLDQMIDLVRPGKPDALLMSRRTRRGISALRRSQGHVLESEVDQFGRRVEFYDGIPIYVSDFVVDTETIASGAFSAKTGGTTSTVFALKFGDGGLLGIESGGIQVERIDPLETKDAVRNRLKWYVSLALLSTLGVARYDGITGAAWTNS